MPPRHHLPAAEEVIHAELARQLREVPVHMVRQAALPPPPLQLPVLHLHKLARVPRLRHHPLKHLPVRDGLRARDGVHAIRLAPPHQQRAQHAAAVLARDERALRAGAVAQPAVAAKREAAREELRHVVGVQVVALDAVPQPAAPDQRLGEGVVARQERHVVLAGDLVAQVRADEARVADAPHARRLRRRDDVGVLRAPARADQPGRDEGDGGGPGEDAGEAGFRVAVVELDELRAFGGPVLDEGLVDGVGLVAGEDEFVVRAGEREGVAGGYAAEVAVAACEDVLSYVGRWIDPCRELDVMQKSYTTSL